MWWRYLFLDSFHFILFACYLNLCIVLFLWINTLLQKNKIIIVTTTNKQTNQPSDRPARKWNYRRKTTHTIERDERIKKMKEEIMQWCTWKEMNCQRVDLDSISSSYIIVVKGEWEQQYKLKKKKQQIQWEYNVCKSVCIPTGKRSGVYNWIIEIVKNKKIINDSLSTTVSQFIYTRFRMGDFREFEFC